MTPASAKSKARKTKAKPLAQSLAGVDWLARKQTQAIMSALGRDNVRVVGGSVRDALLGKPVTDVDMATTYPPDEARQKLEAAGFKIILTGFEHGTVTVVSHGHHYQITSLRADIETDGRHAKVRFGTDWTEDAARRDFTVNALYADADGQIYDPLKIALADLQTRRVVFIGAAEQRIAEDYLRVLRFFRFHYGLSNDPPDRAAWQACAAAAQQGDGLAALSPERIQQEILKILALPNAPDALQSMAEAGVLAFAIPMAENFAHLAQLIAIENKLAVTSQANLCDPILRLGAILPKSLSAVKTTTKCLRLSKKQSRKLAAQLVPDFAVTADMDTRQARQMLYLSDSETFCNACLLAWADESTAAQNKETAQDSDENWLRLLAIAKDWQKPHFPLTGDMMKAAGISAGPLMGRIAKAVEQWWIENDFPDDESRLRAQLEVQMDLCGKD